MKKTLMLSNGKAVRAFNILAEFDKLKVKGLPTPLRYWLGWNRDHLEPVWKRYDRDQKKLIEEHGDIIAVRKEKIQDFLTAVFGDYGNYAKDKTMIAFLDGYVSPKYDSGIVGEEMQVIEEKAFLFGKTADMEEWFKANPKGQEKEVVTTKNFRAFNKALEELVELEVPVEIMTLDLEIAEGLKDEPEVAPIISILTFMWEEPDAGELLKQKPEKI